MDRATPLGGVLQSSDPLRPADENAPDVAVDRDDRPRAIRSAADEDVSTERARSHTRQL